MGLHHARQWTLKLIISHPISNEWKPTRTHSMHLYFGLKPFDLKTDLDSEKRFTQNDNWYKCLSLKWTIYLQNCSLKNCKFSADTTPTSTNCIMRCLCEKCNKQKNKEEGPIKKTNRHKLFVLSVGWQKYVIDQLSGLWRDEIMLTIHGKSKNSFWAPFLIYKTAHTIHLLHIEFSHVINLYNLPLYHNHHSTIKRKTKILKTHCQKHLFFPL